jgi:sec-independent protein translocase protein TatB
MLNIGSGELALILVVALLVLGPKRLPELARGIGKFVREFRRQTDSVRNVVEREFYKMDQDVTAAGTDAPQLQAAPGAVAQGANDALPTTTDAMPSQLTAPMDAQHTDTFDESDPRHPDYYKEQPDPSQASAEPVAAPAPVPALVAAPAPVAAAAPVAAIAPVPEDTSKAKVG